MAKKTKAPNWGRMKNAAVEGWTAVADSGSFLLAAVLVWIEEMSGQAFTKEQGEDILESICAARGWTGDSAKVRKSETRKILRAYREIPFAVEEYKRLAGSDTIGADAFVVLGRRLSAARQDGNRWGEDIQPTLTKAEVTATVTAMFEETDSKGAKKKPVKKADQLKAAVDMLNKLAELRKNWMPDGFHDDVAKLLKKFD